MPFKAENMDTLERSVFLDLWWNRNNESYSKFMKDCSNSGIEMISTLYEQDVKFFDDLLVSARIEALRLRERRSGAKA